MKRYLIVLIVIIFAGLGDAWAQKYPERRVVRAGNKQFEKGNYTEAEVDYKRANSINPTFEGKFNHAGAVYKQERWDDALKEYNALLDDSTDTRCSEVFYNQGNTLFKKNSLKEAIEAYKSALRLNPDDQQAKFNLAYAQKKLKDQQQQQQQQQQNQDQNQQNQQNQNQDQQQQDQDKKQGDKDNKNPDGEQDNKDQNQNQDKNNDNKDKNQQDPENNKGDDKKDNNQNQNNDQNQNQNDPNKNNGPDDGKNDEQNRGDNKGNNGNNQQQQSQKMPQEVAEQMLKAMEANEDKTREKVEGEKKKGYVVGGDIKNW